MIISKDRLLEVGLSLEEIEEFGYVHFNTGDNSTEDDYTDEEILDMISDVKKLKSRIRQRKNEVNTWLKIYTVLSMITTSL